MQVLSTQIYNASLHCCFKSEGPLELHLDRRRVRDAIEWNNAIAPAGSALVLG